jgi:4-hydroxy-4-methyl-2-oxoglutarate aldolase
MKDLRDQDLRCVTKGDTCLVGYASTSKVRTSNPPVTGKAFLDRTDWWDSDGRLPLPRIAVIEDVDVTPANGARLGEVHSATLKARDCDGTINNHAVCDVPAVSSLKFPLFAPSVTVSHSYMHLVDCGEPVEIFGLKVRAGDLLYADCQGVISIPLEIAAELPEAAARIQAKEQKIVQVCLSPDFSTGRLLNAMRSEQQ